MCFIIKTKYDGCTSLHGMLDLEGENRIFKDGAADYKMNLVTLEEFEEEKCESGLKELAGFLKCRQDREKMKEYCRKNKERIQNMDEDTYNAVSVMLDQKNFMEVKEKYRREEGEGINMCKAMEDWAEELLQEGKTQGISQGIRQGLSEGIKAFVTEFREEGKSGEQITAKLIRRFSLTEAEVVKYLK